MNKILLLSDNPGYGGVATATQALYVELNKDPSFLIKKMDLKGGLKNSFLIFIKILATSEKYDCIILMHFKAIFFSLFLTPFKTKKK